MQNERNNDLLFRKDPRFVLHWKCLLVNFLKHLASNLCKYLEVEDYLEVESSEQPQETYLFGLLVLNDLDKRKRL